MFLWPLLRIKHPLQSVWFLSLISLLQTHPSYRNSSTPQLSLFWDSRAQRSPGIGSKIQTPLGAESLNTKLQSLNKVTQNLYTFFFSSFSICSVTEAKDESIMLLLLQHLTSGEINRNFKPGLREWVWNPAGVYLGTHHQILCPCTSQHTHPSPW